MNTSMTMDTLRKIVPLFAASFTVTAALAAPPLVSTTIYPAVPPNISSSSGVKPMMTLATSKDHTLFGPIYTDFEDIDDDGTLDTDFKPAFKYYGYFDATKCYSYSTTDGQFNPAAVATVTTDGRYTCSSSQSYWSGNFLNWSSMTRLDVVRKMLYGGKRSTDTSSLTILERARLNWDAHSFTKYYKGTDIRDYTPFTTSALTKTTGVNANVYAGLTVCNTGTSDNNASTNLPIMRMAIGNYRLWGTVEHQVCRFKDEPVDADSKFTAKLARYYNDADKGGGGVLHEVTLPARATDGATYGSTAGPELTMRVKACDAALLGAERCQAFPPDSTTNYKPYGLLQEFGFSPTSGAAARAEFAVFTGSYDNNVTAGALRKNMGDFADEINTTTGVFCHSSSSGCAATLADGRTTGNGAIKAIDNFLLFGRTSLNYSGSASKPPLTDGDLPAWGNPMGEMVVQALQYYAYNGTTPTPTNPTTTAKDTGVGLPVVTWQDPLSTLNTTRTSLYGKPICRRMYTLALSSSALSFDGQAGTPFATLPNRSLGSLTNYTNAVGGAEGLTGALKSVGSVAGGFGDSCSGKTIATLDAVSGVCPEAPAMGGTYQVAGAALYGNTAKIRTVTSPPPDLKYVRDALKVKTLAASLSGGAARIDVLVPNSDPKAPKKYVYITPESLWSGNTGAPLTFASISSSATHGAFIVTWNDRLLGGDYDMDLTGFLRYDLIQNASSPTGWDIKITTDVPSTCSGAAGTHGFSVIGVTKTPGGASADGRYLTHQHWSTSSTLLPSATEGYLCGKADYRNATNSTTYDSFITFKNTNANGTPNNAIKAAAGACYVNSTGYCFVQDIDFAVTARFNMVGAENAIVKDPLWYASKYGNFTSSAKVTTGADVGTFTEVALPPDVASWDAVKADGTPGADGTPDGYFLARRPDLLEEQLRKALSTIVGKSNSAPATSSTSIQEGSYKYISNFNKDDFSGTVEAKPLLSTGQFSDTADWDSGKKLTLVAPADRVVITNDGTAGLAWRTSTTFSTDFASALLGSGTTALTSAQGTELVDYLRGDRSKEIPTGIWRKRNDDNVMGMVVNSTPWLQSPIASDAYFGSFPTGTPTHAAFQDAQKSVTPLLWVGANDGMLHGFKALGSEAGAPVLSYIPSPLISRLKTMALGSDIVAGMDGSPFTGDVLIGSGSTALWKTYLFSSLGRGGRAIFAMDVTTPSTLSEANAGSIYKWMFSSADDTDLGYIMGDYQRHPVGKQANPIVRMNNDKYAILVPNGPGSNSGKAFLMVLFVEGSSSGVWTAGTNYVKIPTDTLGSNGLTGVTWVDSNSDGKADILYGSDLLGRLWKFDVSSSTVTDWKSAFVSGSTPIPLFEAKSGSDRLAITTSPVVSYPDFGGYMVHFGTGRAIESDASDFPDASKTQRIMTVYDRVNWTTPTRALPNSDLSTMHAFTLTRSSDGKDLFIVAGGNTLFDRTVDDGYYHNFPALPSSTVNNEMVLSSLVFAGGEIKGKSVRPNPSATDYCDPAPLNSNFSFNPLTGLPTGQLGTTDVDIGGVMKKVYVFGKESPDQKSTVVLKINGKKGTWATLGANELMETPEFLVPSRRQWREIPGMRTDQ